jgi:short-subunit dehydrogenase involved in D-alanine esterification of teichoic acids
MVNCAGIARNEGQIASDELFHRTIAVNLIGTVRLLFIATIGQGDANKLCQVEYVH